MEMDGTTITASTIVMVIVLALLVFLVIRGYMKGFLRVALTTFSLVVIIAVSMALVKPLSSLLENTFIGTSVETRVSAYIDGKIESFTGGSEIESNTGEQESFLDTLPIPGFLQDNLKSANTLEEYVNMGVTSFREYTTAKVSGIIIYVIAYIILIVLAAIAVRVVIKLLGLINKIPIIGGFNRIMGALLGLVEGALILWILGVVIMVFSGSETGGSIVGMIHENRVLTYIYENNLLISIFGKIF